MKFFVHVFLGYIFFAPVVLAHATQNSFLQLNLERGTQQTILAGTWEMSLKDLNIVLKLDTNKNGSISLPELAAQRSKIADYLLPKLSIKADENDCVTRELGGSIKQNLEGAYLSLRLETICLSEPKALTVTDTLFFDLDNNQNHRGFLSLGVDNQVLTGVFTPGDQTETLQVAAPNVLSSFLEFVREGIAHIWAGIDHLLFLLALLLPAVLFRQGGAWRAVPTWREAFLNVIKVVSAFTVAHSITLALAAFEIVKLPSRLVEAAIAASVILAALNNIFPVVQEKNRWVMAFAFGLLHGFGFSSVLAELLLDRRSLVSSLLGFNVGVEIGQLLFVALVLPIAFALRRGNVYQRGTLIGGSGLVVLVAGIWLAERVFDFKILPI
jgi:HupE / UreJ protein